MGLSPTDPNCWTVMIAPNYINYGVQGNPRKYSLLGTEKRFCGSGFGKWVSGIRWKGQERASDFLNDIGFEQNSLAQQDFIYR